MKLYFSEALRKKLTRNTYDTSSDLLFTGISEVNRFRPTPFILDTAKYIFNICMGNGLAVKPADNNDHFPVRDIQKVYHECYGLESTPTVMVPTILQANDDAVYYPLQCPLTSINTFRTNNSNSTLTDLDQLTDVLLAYQQAFTDERGAAFGSPLYHASKNTHLSFYHYMASDKHSIRGSDDILQLDPRFVFSYCSEPTRFASDAKLFRGCIRLAR